MIQQILAVTGTNLRSLPARWGASLVVIVGMAGVVAVMVSVLAMAQGFQQTFSNAGREDRVVILRAGEDSGTASAIDRDQLPTILNAPGMLRDSDGRPLASPQKFMTSVLRDRRSGVESHVVLRGVGDKAWDVWPEVRILEGRTFATGKREVIVGQAVQQRFAGLEIGNDVELTNGIWTVVGTFDAGGAVYESELWGDVEMVFAGFSITGQFSTVIALLEAEASFDALHDAITTDPTLTHTVKREPEYYAQQSGALPGLMRLLGYIVATIMAAGALFSAVNTLYAAVKARSREIATLRAIGFGATPIVFSVMLEAVVLCVIGALIGGALAYALFNGYAVSTMNWQSGGQVAFAFQVSGTLLVQGLLWACAVGLVGGLFPAVRTARLPVAEALRG